MKRAVVGGPRTGKTTYAEPDAMHTDALIGLGWSEASAVASEFFYAGEGDIEGVATTRALRKWLDRNPEGRPVDEVVRLTQPRESLTREQESMRKGEQTVWDEIEPELRRRGVRIRHGS